MRRNRGIDGTQMERNSVIRVGALVLVGASAALGTPGSARADEPAIIRAIAEFIRTSDTERRSQLVRAIEQDPAYERAKVSGWLHRAELFAPHPPGRMQLDVPLRPGALNPPEAGGGPATSRAITLRIPQGYDHRKPWPLIYVLHGAGGSADRILGYYEQILGRAVEEHIIAAPTGYGDLVIHQREWPPADEHPAVWRKIKQTVHVDSDRVFVSGYSLGGHTTWTLSVLYTDQFAGAMPLASTFTLLLPDHLWESFLPNLQHLPLLGVWGVNDIHYGGERISPQGGIAGVNRALRELLAGRGRPATMIELPDKGHADVRPPADELQKLLARRRAHWPQTVRHTFRHVCQGAAYWLEPHVWAGEQWDARQRTVRFLKGETPESEADFAKATARTYRALLGEVRGEVRRAGGSPASAPGTAATAAQPSGARDSSRSPAAANEISFDRKRISVLTVWLGDGMLAWEQPVILKAGGRVVFEGQVKPDLYVCLSQAARTWDFDRLRWAGLRFDSRSRTHVVDAATEFPDPFAP
ncbi:MAG: hypothetical protein AB1716_04795 [Planctomycetota bacterium]